MVSKDSAEATALGAAWAKQGAVVTVKPFDRITKNQAIDLSGYHADTPITIKAEPSIWPTAAFINIHEHPL